MIKSEEAYNYIILDTDVFHIFKIFRLWVSHFYITHSEVTKPLSRVGMFQFSEWAVNLNSVLNKTAYFHQLTTLYLPCLHNHLSKSPAFSPFGTNLLAVFYFIETLKFLWSAEFFIKFLIFHISELFSFSQITLDLCPLFTKTLTQAWLPWVMLIWKAS